MLKSQYINCVYLLLDSGMKMKFVLFNMSYFFELRELLLKIFDLFSSHDFIIVSFNGRVLFKSSRELSVFFIKSNLCFTAG